MNTRQIILTATLVGTTIGSFIPTLWGDSFLSMWSVVLTAVGGLVGIYIGYKITR
jgi:hypothetical protein